MASSSGLLALGGALVASSTSLHNRLQDLTRRIAALEHQLRARPARPKRRESAPADFDALRLRWKVIEEERLRGEIARDTAMRADQPETWRRLEEARIAGNRATEALNRRLREAGLDPISLSPSLAARVKYLRRLEAENRAAIATRTGRKAKSGP